MWVSDSFLNTTKSRGSLDGTLVLVIGARAPGRHTGNRTVQKPTRLTFFPRQKPNEKKGKERWRAASQTLSSDGMVKNEPNRLREQQICDYLFFGFILLALLSYSFLFWMCVCVYTGMLACVCAFVAIRTWLDWSSFLPAETLRYVSSNASKDHWLCGENAGRKKESLREDDYCLIISYFWSYFQLPLILIATFSVHYLFCSNCNLALKFCDSPLYFQSLTSSFYILYNKDKFRKGMQCINA